MSSQRDPHKHEFVKKIRRMFLKAGFKDDEVIIRGETEEGPDIIISHNTEEGKNIKILVQCKLSDTPDRPKVFRQLNRLIMEYEHYINEYNADRAILILGGYSLPPKYAEPEEVKRILKKKIAYWDEKLLEYYQKTINTLGPPYSRYIILRDLGFQILLQKEPYEVDAVRFKQLRHRNYFYLFSMEPEKLLNIAYVFGRGRLDPDAYQRILKRRRLIDIANFISTPGAIIANSIIVAFEDKVTFKNGKLRIPAKTCSIWIIDGQHRLYGFTKLSEVENLSNSDRVNILRKFKLPIVGIKAPRKVQGRIFTEINTYQKKINRNLLLDLCDYLDLDIEENILLRVRIARELAQKPYFKGKIKILETDKGKITLANIVDYSRYKELVRQYGRRAKTILDNYFRAVSEVFPREWDDSSNYIFSTNKGTRMLISLLYRIIDYCRRKNKRMNYDTFKEVLEKLRDATSSIPDYFKVENYTGIALGAGAPDIVARDLWASRLHSVIPEFLSEEELNKIGMKEKEVLEKLENKLRECVSRTLHRIAGDNWWDERVPPDVRENAEKNKERNEKPWPWMKNVDYPLIYYVDFTGYRKIILKRDNWREAFKEIFKDEIIIDAKLRELEIIRNNIAHNRKLTPDQYEILVVNSKHIIKCIDEAFEKEEVIA